VVLLEQLETSNFRVRGQAGFKKDHNIIDQSLLSHISFGVLDKIFTLAKLYIVVLDMFLLEQLETSNFRARGQAGFKKDHNIIYQSLLSQHIIWGARQDLLRLIVVLWRL
jgi:hypothetical protein